MTIQEWRENPALAAELNKILKNPTLIIALDLLEKLTMANTLAGGQLLSVAQNGQTLFGYDVGRASFLNDLRSLTIEVKQIPTIKPTYAN